MCRAHPVLTATDGSHVDVRDQHTYDPELKWRG
jgi:hypothetical protein